MKQDFENNILKFADSNNFIGIRPITVGRARIKGGSSISIFEDNESIILFIKCGKGTKISSDADGRESSVGYSSNSVIAKGCGDFTLCAEIETVYMYVTFSSGKELADYVDSFGSIGCNSSVEQGFERMISYGEEEGSIFNASSHLYGLIMDILACSKKDSKQYSELVQTAIAKIWDDFAFLSGIDELADFLEVTKSHLIRKFADEAGITPGKFLQNVRVESAKLMLLSREYSIEMVANMVGYSGANYFAKIFRKETGYSPGEYRKKFAQKAIFDRDAVKRLEKIDNYIQL